MALNASDFNATCHAACTADEGCVELCVAESNPEIVVDPLSIVIAVVLIGLSGLFSGLTLGLMSLDPQGLKIMIAGGNPTERRQAERILPVREQGNLLLCTLLLGNTLVNAQLAILTASITSGVLGGIISTAFILIFGEIIPQSFCSRYGLAAGSKTVDLVRVFMVVLYPVVKPVSMALDKLLGAELGQMYSKGELIQLIRSQARMRAGRSQGGDSVASSPGERPSGEDEGLGEGEGGGASSEQSKGGRDHITGEAATYMCGALLMSERTVEQVGPSPSPTPW